MVYYCFFNQYNCIKSNNKRIPNIISNVIISIIIFLPLVIGTLIGYFYRDKWGEDKYKNLKKPEYYPPNYLFGIVWPILYLMIGTIYSIALYYEYCIDYTQNRYYCTKYLYFKPFSYWIIPTIALIFNFAYIPAFFGENGLFNGFIMVIMSLIFAILTFLQFIMQSNKYYYTYILVYILLLPYIAWLSYATYLSYNIYILNK
tara:strand:+ start:104 stop:709 length:606 start_codon:yes stop_codon:yes gene_type:complete